MMLNYEQSCKEWVKGCSNTIDGHAEDCEECTRIFREHIEKLMKAEDKPKEDNMTETVLFVGGSADGKQREVEIKDDVVYFEQMVLAPGGFRVEIYRREAIVRNMKSYYFYIPSTESPDNLIPLLIEGYRRKE